MTDKRFKQAWKEFAKLPYVVLHPATQKAIADLVIVVQGTLDLDDDGHSEPPLTTAERIKLNAFIERWS